MIGLDEITIVIANAFFNGNTQIAGIVLFIVALAIIFAITKNVFHSLLIALPVTFIFNLMGVLSQDMMILMIVIAVLGLALTSKKVLGGGERGD